MSCFEERLHKITEALSSGEVADAAQVGPSEWASYHVFDDGIGEDYIKGRNRGRLPYCEINQVNTDFTQATFDGQYEESTWVVRINVKGSNPSELRKNSQRIARTFLNIYKQDIQERSGAVSIDQVVNTPFGGYVDITISFEDVDSDYSYNDEEF